MTRKLRKRWRKFPTESERDGGWVICGVCAKSYLCGCFNEKLPEKRYKILSLAHSSLTGSDLIRHLCRQLGLQPQMRRSNNVADIHSALGQLAAAGRCWCSKKRKTSRPVHWKK
jgi:hypothetical protein